MTQLSVEATATARAAPEVAWTLVADANSYPQWGPGNDGSYERSADDDGHGTGAVRWLRYGRTTIAEQILEVDDGRRVVYAVVRGMPVRNYRAEVTLTPRSEGTRIDWAATWDRTLAGRIVHHKLRTVFPDIVGRLAVAADRRAAAP